VFVSSSDVEEDDEGIYSSILSLEMAGLLSGSSALVSARTDTQSITNNHSHKKTSNTSTLKLDYFGKNQQK
jgi:hypothetical protein